MAVTAAVYYQSFEAVVEPRKNLLGNLADTDLDGTLEPCVLKKSATGGSPLSSPPWSKAPHRCP